MPWGFGFLVCWMVANANQTPGTTTVEDMHDAPNSACRDVIRIMYLWSVRV